jgi:hypothetical protein
MLSSSVYPDIVPKASRAPPNCMIRGGSIKDCMLPLRAPRRFQRWMLPERIGSGGKMHRPFARGLAILLSLSLAAAAAAETPKGGGMLTYMIPADAPPSFDGHREGTFATIHAVAPFYSVLIRVNPENPASTTDFVCDVCAAMPEPTDGGVTYAFPIRSDARQITHPERR